MSTSYSFLQSRSLLLLFCLCFLSTTSSFPSSSFGPAVPAAATSSSRRTNDPSNAYALYSLPPFTITFTSSYSTRGLPDDVEEQGQLLAATLHGPLQLITSEFLVESFRMQIYALKEPTRNATQHDIDLQNTLDSFMTLDLQVAVRPSPHLSLNDPQVRGRRSLLSVETGGGEPVPRQPRAYYDDQQQQQDGESSSGNTDVHTFHGDSGTDGTASHSSLLQFEADFFTTAAFLEPSSQQSGRPTDKDVVDLLAGWVNGAFAKDLDYYHDSLVNSEAGVLKHMEQLHVETDSGAIYDPYVSGSIPNVPLTTGSGAIGPATNAPPKTKQDVVPPPNAAAAIQNSSGSSIGAWSPSEKLFFTLLVMVSILSIAGLLIALKKYRGRGRYLEQMMAANDRALEEDFTDPRICISGRHSDEILDILNASDRYLAAHRPDLLEAMQQHQHGDADARRSSSGSGIVPIATNNDELLRQQGGQRRPTERRYVTVSNPFSYLYGASYFHSQKAAVEQDRALHGRGQDPMDAVELQPQPSQDESSTALALPGGGADDPNVQLEQQLDHSVSKYLQTWFQQLVGARTVDTHVYNGEDDEYDDEDYYDDGMEELDLNAAQDDDNDPDAIMACDEDPSQYTFPFQDFPRQDGTPCLIYEETLNEEEEEQYLMNSRRADSLHSTTTYGVHDPLTDDEFQRALGQHMLTLPGPSPSKGPGGGDACDSGSVVHVVVDKEEEENDQALVDLRSVNSGDDGDDNNDNDDPSKFTNKLEKMVAMRHRHYEKQKILDKHREQRKQERARQRAEEKKKQQAEMQQRDLLLRRHSLELDIQELEAAAVEFGTTNITPTSASKVITPSGPGGGGHGQQASWQQQPGDLRQLQRPNLHRRTSSEADVDFLSPEAAAAASGAGIHTNRSMDLDDAYSTNMTTKSDTHRNTRLVQSAQKAPRATAASNTNDVFRDATTGMKRVSPLSSNSATSSSGGDGMPPTSVTNDVDEIPVVSPASSMTDSSPPSSAGSNNSDNHSMPPRGMGSASLRGTRKKKKKHLLSSASKALARGFQKRRSLSFGGMEEKKVEDEGYHGDNSNSSVVMSSGSSISGGSRGRQMLPPQQPHQQRTHSANRHRRSNSSSPADVMVHGIYAQFV